MLTKDILKKVFASPTAPFREQFVLRSIEDIAKSKKWPYTWDKFGNFILGVKNIKELAVGKRVLLFAHTDHPGFHILKQTDAYTLEAKWYGGAPFKKMKGAKVRIYDPALSTLSYEGRVTEFESGAYKRTGMRMKIRLKRQAKVAKGSFGAFDFSAYQFQGNKVVTRVADDLAGCVLALGAYSDLKGKQKQNIACVFTRAEEVGYIGCLSFLKSYQISKHSFAISLEASRTLPGALLGKGPVLRLGDRSTLFDNPASQYLKWVADNIKHKDFCYQRRIMDGGSCEATALNHFGVRTTGLAVPLANYHNEGSRGPAPEIIDIRDVENARVVCREAAKQIKNFSRATDNLDITLKRNHKKLSRLLGVKQRSFLEI